MNESILQDSRQFFWLRDGRAIHSIRELLSTLPSLSEKEFSSYVQEGKNDFVDWIQGVFHDDETANIVRSVITNDALQETLRRHIKKFDEQNTNTTNKENIANKKIQEPVAEERSKTQENEQLPTTLAEPRRITDSADALDIAALDPDILAAKNDKIADRFDQATRRLEEKTQYKTPEALLKRIEILQEQEAELRQEISAARKAGFDPFMADIMLQRFASRLKLAQATEKEQDFALVETTVHEARKELLDAQKQPPINVKKEIEELANT